jgi:hypothetical protein
LNLFFLQRALNPYCVTKLFAKSADFVTKGKVKIRTKGKRRSYEEARKIVKWGERVHERMKIKNERRKERSRK